MSRHITSATFRVAVAFSMTTVLVGCVPGLAADPRFATNSGARPQGVPTTKPPPSGPPPASEPMLRWNALCGVFSRKGMPAFSISLFQRSTPAMLSLMS